MRIARLLFACVALGSIAYGDAVNAANYRTGVAQGAIFVLFGNGIGPNQTVQAGSLPLPTQIGNTSIRVTVGARSVDAFMIYASSMQVGALLPSNTPVGDGILTVTYNGRRSDPVPIRVATSAFGIFSRDQTGIGPGIIQNQDATTNALNKAAHPGEVAVIWGTGLGPISGSDAVRPPVGNLNMDVTVLVGGTSAEILYQGRSADFPGLDQVVFRVPDGVDGCYVPVAVNVAGTVSNFTSMAVTASADTCSDPTSFAAQDVDTAARNGRSQTGLITMTRTVNAGSTAPVDVASAEFRRDGFDAFLASHGPGGTATALGTCTAVTFPVDPKNPDALDPPSANQPVYLNAGLAIGINGPVGNTQIGRQSWGGYSGSIGTFVEPGSYSAIGGRSGADVDSFQVAQQVPAGITWTNINAGAAVQRSVGLEITWSGGDDSREFVLIRGAASNASQRGVFTCMANVAAGSLLVPAEVLLALPASTTTPGMLEVGSLTRLGNARFSAIGLDGVYFRAQRTTRIVTVYQ
jgi:uncharacterized protein (TIGR03437 family)